MPEPTPDAWAQIRRDYEHTDRPLAHICAEHDITIPMMRYRMKRWEWTRRKPLIPRQGPPPVQVMQQENVEPPPAPYAAPVHPTPAVFTITQTADPPPPGEGEEPAGIVPRLQAAVARVLPAIEATIARLAGGAHHPREMEQASRTLGALMRTLRELNGLLAQHNARPDDARCECREMSPEDIDAFRENLARRINAFMASRSEERAQPGAGLPLDAQK